MYLYTSVGVGRRGEGRKAVYREIIKEGKLRVGGGGRRGVVGI